jgi:glycosyltransferase involved in cell wall biosynthesis
MNISVVIPTYNRARTILRTVNSVLNQTLQPFEIIIVDDGSSDETVSILEAVKELKIISQANKGVSAARNIGIGQAKGMWIALLDSDDEWVPDYLAKQVGFARANPELEIFQSEEIWIRNGKRVNPRLKYQKQGGWIFKACLPLCIVAPSAVLFKKELWQKIGGFDESFPVCEDYDLWLRIARNYPIGLNKFPGMIKFGGHGDQLSTTFPAMDTYRIRAIEKHLNDDSFFGGDRIFALKEIIQKMKIYIDGALKRGHDVSGMQKKIKKYKNEINEII